MAISRNIKADTTYTLQDFIDMRDSDEITYYNFSILEYLNGYDMFVTNLLYDYEDELLDLAISIKLTPIEKIKYRYKPYLLGFDLYGSQETKFIIMMLNGIIDPKEFDFDKVKVIYPNDLLDILSRISSVNETYMNNNRYKLSEDIAKGTTNLIWDHTV